MVRSLTPSAGPFAPADDARDGSGTITPDDRLALTPLGREILALLQENDDG